MRQGHFVLLFAIVYISCMMALWIVQKNYDRTAKEVRNLEEGLAKAVEEASRTLAQSQGTSDVTAAAEAEAVFFETWYAVLHALEDEEEQKGIQLYIPLLAVLDLDGFYLNTLQEYEEEDGSISLKRCWSAYFPYSYGGGALPLPLEEGYWEKKRALIAQELETAVSEVITEHNRIAGQFGIHYQFVAPDFLQTCPEAAENPGFLAVFQGWPLDNGFFNMNCFRAASYLRETEWYTVEVPCYDGQPYAVYHRKNCPEIGQYGTVLSEEQSAQDAVLKYGAFACPECFSDSEQVFLVKKEK